MQYVTVSFLQDLMVLKLQALSLSKYLPSDSEASFIVVNNHYTGAERDAFERIFLSEVLPAYGRFSERVKILRAEDLVPGLGGLSGWRTQQPLKFAVARYVQNDIYVTLDSKNQLIRPVTDRWLYADDGRILIGRRKLDDVLRPSYKYWMGDEKIPEWGFVIWTPSVLIKQHVLNMLDEMDGRENGSGLVALARRTELLEYAVYYGYLISKGLASSLYTTDEPPHGGGFWFGGQAREVINFTDNLLRTRDTIKWMFVRRQITTESDEVKAQISRLWVDFGLCATVEEGLGYIKSFSRK